MKRPLSSQNPKPFFGEFTMTKKLDIIPKVTNYLVDGSGRDGYINFNNGGNIPLSSGANWNKYSSKRGIINSTTKSYNIVSKVALYKSDGAGRDQYIVKDCGGFYREGPNIQKPITPYTFKTLLRSYERTPTIIKPNDFSYYSKTFQTKKEKNNSIQQIRKQKSTSERLSTPKKYKV